MTALASSAGAATNGRRGCRSAANGDPTTGGVTGQAKCLGFLVRQGSFGPAGGHRLGVDPGRPARMQAGEDDAVLLGVEQGQGEALVAAGVLEWIEPDEADPLECPPPLDLEAVGPSAEFEQVGLDRDNPAEVGFEDPLEALAVLAPGHPVEPGAESRSAPPEEQDRRQADDQSHAQDRHQDCGIGHVAESSRARVLSSAVGGSPPESTRRTMVPMAKRARGTTRPGQRRPIQRVARPTPGVAQIVPPPEGLSQAEVARAAVLEAELVASERVEHAPASRRTETAPPFRRRPGGVSRLALEAAEEYRYVARDVRRIALIGGSMFGILAVLYVLLALAGVGTH